MPIKKRVFKKILLFISLLIVAIAIDKFLIRTPAPLPVSEEIQYQKREGNFYIFSYSLYPFQKYINDDNFVLPEYNEWVVSHPVGIGSHNKFMSLSIDQLSDKATVECRYLYFFADGYSDRTKWYKLIKNESGYEPVREKRSRFLQFRVRKDSVATDKLNGITLSIESVFPVGVPGILNKALYNNIITNSNQDNDTSVILERPVRKVLLDSTFQTYRMVNLLNGFDCITIGVFDLKQTSLKQILFLSHRYGSVIKIWNLKNIKNCTRLTAQRISEVILRGSKGAVILWENEGLISDSFYSQEQSDKALPIKINRGTLWSVILLFTFFFLVKGTTKALDIHFSFPPKRILRSWKVIIISSLVYLLPVMTEFIYPASDTLLIRLLLLALIVAFVSELLRGIIIKTLESSETFRQIFGDKRKDAFAIIFSALLISLLYAGYPEYSLIGSALLISANFVNGILYGLIFKRYNSYGLTFVIHLLAIIPLLVLLGR